VQNQTVLAGRILRAAAALLVLAGCTQAHYRHSADKEVYGIVQQYERKIFGHTNAFTIDTAYSARKPAAIPPSELIEDRLRTGHCALSITQALDLAVNTSRRYQSAKEALYLKALELTGSRYAFTPLFFANAAPVLTRRADGSTSSEVLTHVGVNQFLTTGGQLGASIANDILHYYSGDPVRSVSSLITVNLAQPLLRGFGRNNPVVENLTQSERNVIYAVREFSFFQNQFALEIVNDYIGLLALKDIMRNRYTNYLGRVQSTQRLEARASDRERLADVDQARQSELTAKNNYVNSVANYRNALDAFKIKLGLPVGERLALEDQPLDEMEQTGLVPAPMDPDTAYRVAVTRQLQILNAIDKFEDSKRKICVAANQLKADLKIVADAELLSNGPTDYTRFDANKWRGDIGLTLNLPIDRVPERNEYRSKLVAFEAELRALTLTLDNLKEDIDQGLRTLDQRRQNYEIQKNALTLANRRVQSTTLLLEAGRAEVRDLLDAQDSQISAENEVTAALVSYQQTRLQLLLNIGALDTTVPKFWLKDPLVAYLHEAPPATGSPEPKTKEDEILPPEHYFGQ
jgi:outer membrane protein TolC